MQAALLDAIQQSENRTIALLAASEERTQAALTSLSQTVAALAIVESVPEEPEPTVEPEPILVPDQPEHDDETAEKPRKHRWM
jgi:hypothetical protein